MTVDEALIVVEEVLHLNKVQEVVFRHAWAGESYSEIALVSSYDLGYVKDIGYKLWQALSESFGEKVTKQSLQSVITRAARKRVHQSSDAFLAEQKSSFKRTQISPKILHDWGEAPDVSVFYGRTEQLQTLEQWIVSDRYRMVAILGMVGIGKTALSVTLAEEIQNEFTFIAWRSLRTKPTVMALLESLIKFLSQQPEAVVPESFGDRVTCLIEYLRKHRCLIILDNIETILCSGDRLGFYLDGYENYGELLRRIGESQHQSCLIITSREQPKELALLEGTRVRSLFLKGLMNVEGRDIFTEKGISLGTDSDCQFLIEHYAGNPLALRIVASVVQGFFDNDISSLVALLKRDRLVFKDIQALFDQHFERLSDAEKKVMYWLTVIQEVPSLQDLENAAIPSNSLPEFLQALNSLCRRSLLEKHEHGFMQSPLILEYFTEKLVEQVYKSQPVICE